MEKISIVVPIYNVENYIVKNIESLINQSYKNIEIILVDDGSPDKCGSICDEYAKKDDRIVVIHKKNGGLSDARNAGIDIATGEYITFIDSDDYVSSHYCEILYNSIKENNADISICNYISFDEGEECKEKVVDDVIVMNSIEALQNLYNVAGGFGQEMHVAWGKLYKMSLFKSLRYPVGKINEDEFVIHHLYGASDKVVLNKSVLYFYLQRGSSIMGQTFSEKRLAGLEALMDRINYFKDNNMRELMQETCKQYNYFIRNNYYLTEDKKLRKKLMSYYLPVEYFKGYFSFKNYVSYYLFKFAPSIFRNFMKNKS